MSSSTGAFGGRHAALLVLLALCLAQQALVLRDGLASLLAAPDRLPRAGLVVAADGRVLSVGAGQVAGPLAGDRIVVVDGEPWQGRATLITTVAARRAGEELPLRVVREGRETAVAVTLQPRPVLGHGDRALLVVLVLLSPLLAIALGFGVAWVRPRDPLAWLLLLLLLGFTAMGELELIQRAAWPWPLRPIALFWRHALGTSWPFALFLFALRFPDRLPLDVRRPAFKWLLAGPLMIDAVVIGLYGVVAADFGAVATSFEAYAEAARLPRFVLTNLAIGSFFAITGYRMGTTRDADDRRRLRMLNFGATAALLPIFPLVLLNGIFGVPLATISPLYLVPALLALALLPITLAYVIVVERAMGISVVLRQGLQYALARRGIRVLQGIGAGLALTAGLGLALDPGLNRPRKIQAIATGVMFAVIVGRAGERVRRALDRRFFREAYDAERILSEVSEEVREIVDVRRLVDTLARRLSDALHASRLAVLLREGPFLQPALALGYGDGPPLAFDGNGPVARRLAEAKEPPRVYLDDPESWANQPAAAAERGQLQALGSELLLPLSTRSGLLGFLALGPKKSEEPYSPLDVRLLRSVAGQASLALHNAQLAEQVAAEVAQRARFTREVEIAREVQEQLYPRDLPRVPGLDLAGHCRPARGVGGDYYDFLSLDDGRIGIAIGDISGKGIPAALLMASLQASLRSQTIGGARGDLATLMGNLNRLIHDASPSNRYATFFYAEYDPSNGRLAYVNAGHNAPMLFRAGGGPPERLEVGGPVIGLLPIAAYVEGAALLRPGDALLGFTDGISEAMDPSDEEWGEERMAAAFEACAGLAAAPAVERMIEAADGFAAGAPQYDDMTVIVVRRS
ncbi:MAG: SpoIIE family protein phosphatase [Vicinamibacteria bacterium]|nr:SpoIIE family protein phosphatase [Vicinamibacteria bacterium]